MRKASYKDRGLYLNHNITHSTSTMKLKLVSALKARDLGQTGPASKTAKEVEWRLTMREKHFNPAKDTRLARQEKVRSPPP